MRMMAAVMMIVAAVSTASGETIRQRPYAHGLDDVIELLPEDEFIVCSSGCADDRPTRETRLVVRVASVALKVHPAPVLPVPVPAQASEMVPGPVATVHFGFDDWTLSERERQRLDVLEPGLPPVTVKGYACTTGPSAHNEKLSARRAEQVAGYLKLRGVPVLSTEGSGESSLFPEKRLNRRVEVLRPSEGLSR